MLLTLRIFRTGRLAMQQDRFFAAYLSYGAGIVIGMQSLINIGVNTGMLPTKGLTLPFISYGGNSLLVCCVLLGFAIRTSVEQTRV
jgi:cell division protein FtsW